ncbi:MAG: hypothetical protein R3B13_29410 [Polyangiaceae bacterium]
MTREPVDARPPIPKGDVWSLLGKVGSGVVLVGGQALSVWAEHYAASEPGIAEFGPYTSKDVDFRGNRQDVEECARRLGCLADYDVGKAFGSIIEAVVTFQDSTGVTRTIDFLRRVEGLGAREVADTAIELEVEESRIRVMHPVLVLVSRATNVVKLREHYDNEHGVEQLHVAVLCARAFLRAAMASGNERLALNWAERAYKLINSSVGATLWAEKGLDLLQAIPLSDMPHKFRITRYPQMERRFVERRERKARALQGRRKK